MIPKARSGWSVRAAMAAKTLGVAVELDAVGARAAEHGEQLRTGEGDSATVRNVTLGTASPNLLCRLARSWPMPPGVSSPSQGDTRLRLPAWAARQRSALGSAA
jgi:hypothetical protein